jgi:hypothetical protein
MTDKMDIPESTFEVKADYFERPSKELVRLIKEFIDRFGTPHLWWGHTHTHPTKGSRVTFLAKYSLPKSHHAPDRWAPCPCCSPRHPKYFRQGLIAWFPDEGVIRCVGDQCYKKLDPEGYELAMKQLNTEIEAERTENFLLTRIPLIPDYIRTLQTNLPPIEALDQMLNKLQYTLYQTFGFTLWAHVETGILQCTVKRTELRRGRDGEEDLHEFDDFETYGAIAGFSALRPMNWRMAKRLSDRIRNFDLVNFGPDPLPRLSTMTELERRKVVKILTYAHNKARDICAEAEDARRFFTTATLSTINGWSQTEGSPERVHFAMDQEGFYVARDAEESHTRIRWPENFWNTILQLEFLTRSRAA